MGELSRPFISWKCSMGGRRLEKQVRRPWSERASSPLEEPGGGTDWKPVWRGEVDGWAGDVPCGDSAQ